LSDLINDLGYVTSYDEMQKRFENIHNHSDHKTFVASIDKQIVGMVGATQNNSYEQNGKYVRVIALVTNPLFRQKGIGKKLMQVVEDWAKKLGHPRY
jgi:GNAT superfamily N-acetyltransferase